MEILYSEEVLLEEVLFDWFPNATSEEDLEYELECMTLNND